MSRYIDADKLQEEFKELHGGKRSLLIDTQPTADVRENVRGEWIEVEVFPEVYDIEGIKTWGSEMQCDQCGFRHTAVEGHMTQYNFCPNCGADMRTASQIVHDMIDNTPMAEDVFTGIKERMHKAVDDMRGDKT